jgi:cytochrome c oxidase subunit 1
MGAIYGLLAGFYYWVGKITGFQYREKLGMLHFAVFTIAVLAIFGPMHGLGLAGMPRRIPNYPDGYVTLNSYMTFGSILTVCSFMIFLYLIVDTFRPSLTQLASNNSIRLNHSLNSWS